MTDTTAARRQLLGILLDRVDRGALLPSERPLLRACVVAEQAVADARESTMERSYVDRAEQAETTVARVRELAERWGYVPGLKDSPRASLLRALDGPSPTADDIPTGCDAQYHGFPGETWHCQLKPHDTDTDHLNAEHPGTLRWSESAAVYPTGDAPSEPQQ
jgi:hypothetical protein